MGKLDSTGTLAQTRGRQGGLVVSSNSSGGYARAWFMPRNPRTESQLAWARKWQEWIQKWTELTAGQRATWEAAALDATWTRADWFGQTYQPSGLNLWIMIAALRDSLGLALSITAPTGTPPTNAISCTMDLTAQNPVTLAYRCRVTLGQAYPAVWTYIQIETVWMISSRGAARNKPFRPFYAAPFGTSELWELTTRANEMVGWLYQQTNCWFRWRGWTSGLLPGAWQTGYGTR
jgi:hypothetical protein